MWCVPEPIVVYPEGGHRGNFRVCSFRMVCPRGMDLNQGICMTRFNIGIVSFVSFAANDQLSWVWRCVPDWWCVPDLAVCPRFGGVSPIGGVTPMIGD